MRRRPGGHRTAALIAAVIIQGSVVGAQLATADRIEGPGWWPTKGAATQTEYAGTAGCTPCHGSQSASQPSTSMARTAIRAERSDVLHDSPRLTFDSGGYSYEIASGVDRQPIYTVVNGTQSSFWDISLAGEKGIPALRSQPYRLQSSRCWSARDVRLTCVACHDPHRPLVTDGRAYDERCLTCHVTSGVEPTSERMGRACSVGTSNCVGCHMPKYDVPDMHHEFTDHLIQVPKRGH